MNARAYILTSLSLSFRKGIRRLYFEERFEAVAKQRSYRIGFQNLKYFLRRNLYFHAGINSLTKRTPFLSERYLIPYERCFSKINNIIAPATLVYHRTIINQDKLS